MSNQNGSDFIPNKQPQPGAKMPPKVDNRILSQATQLACNLVGFPCEVQLLESPTRAEPYYLIAPDLDLVQQNIIIYSHLKEFQVFYLQAHQSKPGGNINKVTCFTNLVTAIYDFGLHWNQYSQLDPQRSASIVQLCRMANAKSAEAIIAEAQAKKQ